MIRVQSLGGLRVKRDGEELAALSSQPLRAAMLVVLAVERDVRREKICALLWPDRAPARARRVLSQTLLMLKKELGAGWIEADGERLRTTDELWVDVEALISADAGDDARGVVDLYSGPFLDGERLGGTVEFERWVDAKQSEVNRLVRKAFAALVAEAEHPQGRVEWARRWASFDPLDDEAQHSLIESLAVAGLRREALDCFESYRRLIASELEVEPLDHTVALVEGIRDGTFPAPEPGSPAGDPRTSRPESAVQAEVSSISPRALTVELSSGLQAIRVLGSGRTGTVYLARQPSLRRLVAVKLLDTDLSAQPRARARFRRETLLAARILHPNVATVYDVGEDPGGTPFFIMPFVKGVTLAERLEAGGPLPPAEARRVLGEVAGALAAAHAAGVLHRDVRPANVIYEEDTGRTYLVDFGVAGTLEAADPETVRLTRTGEFLGNVDYVSPEQARARELTDRSDVYSFGIMGWELLSGRPARGGAVPHSGQEDRELVSWLERATSKNPRHRPSAKQLAEALSSPAGSQAGKRKFVNELLSRRLLPILGAYLAAGFVGMQAVDQLVQQAILPPIVYVLSLAFFVAGLHVAVILGWFHGERGHQEAPWIEKVLLAVVFLGWLLATILIVV